MQATHMLRAASFPSLALPRFSAETLALLALVAGAVLWGASTVASKALLGTFPPITLAALRFTLALFVLCPLLGRAGMRPATGRLPFLLGLTGVLIVNILQNVGLGFTSATAATLVIEGGAPVLTAVFGVLLLRERLGRRRATGLIVALVGVTAVVVGGQDLAALLGPGSLLPLGAALAQAAYNLLGRRAFAAGALPVVAGAARYGLVLLLPGVVLELNRNDIGQITMSDGLWLLYLGVGSTVVAFVLWGYGLARLEAGQVAVVGTLLPVSGVAAAAFCLGEPLGVYHLGGALLVVLGIHRAAERNRPSARRGDPGRTPRTAPRRSHRGGDSRGGSGCTLRRRAARA
jgi:drug/metabolite transporter (DMT)-like permease